ncbi:MAG: hypothetical protein J2O48_01870 [Solirubrobacterales bacterium]|nr:hypothetical protein [Solirubrobacterales bacterium]
MRRPLLGGAALVTCALLAGCSGGGGSVNGAVPSGYTLVRDPGFQFAVPSKFQAAPVDKWPEGGGWDRFYQAPKDPYDQGHNVEVEFGQGQASEISKNIADEQKQMKIIENGKGFTNFHVSKVQVPGAASAQEFTYDGSAKFTSTKKPAHSIELWVALKSGDAINLHATDMQGDATQFDPKAVVDSFKVG